MIKAAFFDIDGTLVFHTTGFVIPESARKALIELRQCGVKLFICTGRPRVQLTDEMQNGFEGFGGPFDGYITMTGSCCYDKDGIYYSDSLSPDLVKRFYEHVAAGEFDTLTLMGDRVFCNAPKSERVRELERFVNFYYPEEPIENILKETVYQFCAFVDPSRDEELKQELGDCIITRWCDQFCDVVPSTSSKPKGVQKTLEHFGIQQEETIAFGDGGNDATMLEYCHIGVAMGNATDECKAAADYVTTNIEDDGIANALRHFGLIDKE